MRNDRARMLLEIDPVAAARAWGEGAVHLATAIERGPLDAGACHDLSGFHLAHRRALLAAGLEDQARAAAAMAVETARAHSGYSFLNYPCALVATGQTDDAIRHLLAMASWRRAPTRAQVLDEPLLAGLSDNRDFKEALRAFKRD